MAQKSPLIRRDQVITEIRNKIARIDDPSKLAELFKVTANCDEVCDIVKDRWEIIATAIALTEVAKCTTEEDARKLYQNNIRPPKGESDTIYFECWVHFANKEAPTKAKDCKTHQDVLNLYENAPKESDAKKIYFELLEKIEKNTLFDGYFNVKHVKK